MTIKLDIIETLALASVVLFAGYAIRRRVSFLERYSIPAPVVGGFLFALALLPLRLRGILALDFDMTLKDPLMIAFFTSIGLGASLRLLRVGGPQVPLFLALATTLAFLQNAAGVGLSKLLGVHPLLGLISGSITMTGGHGTGAAFGKLIEDQYGFAGGATLAMAAATFGLVSGGLLGGPVATALLRRHRPPHRAPIELRPTDRTAGHGSSPTEEGRKPAVTSLDAYTLLQVVTVTLVAMWMGSLLSRWLGNFITLPAYIGAMLVAAVIRNGAELLDGWRIGSKAIEDVGMAALSLFLAMALMSLRLWELLDLAIPMLIILTAQVSLMGVFAYFVTFRFLGRDYDAAVMAGGHCGFGLGATPNAVANMEAITERYGHAPRAFLVVPMVGGFFIDFTNALIITAFLNWIT